MVLRSNRWNPDPTRTLEEHLSLERELVAEWSRQHELWAEREEQLSRTIVQELKENDLAWVRAWTGRVSFAAYLETLLPLLLEEVERRRGRSLLETRYPLIRRLCLGFARKKRLDEDETEELLSGTSVRLCEAGYRALRRFRGDDGQLAAYLKRIVRTVFIDGILRRKKGRFRPSEQARGLGLEAEILEELIFARGLAVGEATRRLRQEIWVRRSEDELTALVAGLPARERLQELPVDTIAATSIDPSDAEEKVRRCELEKLRERFILAFREAREHLTPTAQLLLRLLFAGGMTVAEAARSLSQKQRPLYRLRDQALGQIREELEAAGLDWETVRPLVEGPDLNGG